uniref:Putative secreted peptide n=1 Tax=Anopheles braziliensis TaxID=58242 RepID=A0A2M3ZQ34_9DIPT
MHLFVCILAGCRSPARVLACVWVNAIEMKAVMKEMSTLWRDDGSRFGYVGWLPEKIVPIETRVAENEGQKIERKNHASAMPPRLRRFETSFSTLKRLVRSRRFTPP